MTRKSIERAAPLLLQIAEMTLEMFERGELARISPDSKAFEDTLRRVIKLAKMDSESEVDHG